MHPLFFADVTEGESPAVWYSIYRRTDRLWASLDRAQLEDERRTFDAARLSPRCRYLVHHILRLQSRAYPERFDTLLWRYPGLEALRTVEDIEEPIALSENPRGAWRYLTEHGIYL